MKAFGKWFRTGLGAPHPAALAETEGWVEAARRYGLPGVVTDHEGGIRCIQQAGGVAHDVDHAVLPDDVLTGVDGEGTVIELTVDNGPAAAADALRRIDASGIALVGLQLREPSLDDVFLNLTGHKAEEPVESDAATQGRRARRKSKV